ncbi:hypothetical protein M0R45_024419 [Rubus argutus]|uniref:Uncharacterized protein n=1 Tax=Rubus argutus TaxID=59490 RepID=A0AAW1WR44_RUBAR
MELEIVDEQDRSRILGPHKKVLEWIENTKTATRPHFEEVHQVLYRAKARFQEQRSMGSNNMTNSSNRMALPSKM